MGNNYTQFFNHTAYSLKEVLCQFKKIKEMFCDAHLTCKKGVFHIHLFLQPTEFSKKYKIRLKGKLGNTKIQVFVIDPKINQFYNKKIVPHMYKDGSLCLYYPKYQERKDDDFWAATLVPWTSLWLYYFEIWQQTGNWLGEGIHV